MSVLIPRLQSSRPCSSVSVCQFRRSRSFFSLRDWSVITLFRANFDTRCVLWRGETNHDLSPGAVQLFVRWAISYRVLIPQIAGNPGANFFDLIHTLGKEISTAGNLGKASQRLFSHAAIDSISIKIRTQQTDRVYHDLRLADCFEHLVEVVLAFVVLSVTDNEQHLFLVRAVTLQIVCCQKHS